MSDNNYSGRDYRMPSFFCTEEKRPRNEFVFSMDEVLSIVRALGHAQGALDALFLTCDMSDYQKDGAKYVNNMLKETGDMIIHKLGTP